MAKYSEWQSLNTTMPPNNVWVEVIGPSLMLGSPKHFLAIAKHWPEYSPLNPWRDRTNSALSDNGWVPTHWRHLQPVPDVGL